MASSLKSVPRAAASKGLVGASRARPAVRVASRTLFRVSASASQDGSAPSIQTNVSGRRAAIGSMVASIAAAGLVPVARAIDTQQELETIETELSSSFAVDLGGFAVDHKSLVYGVFIGQWVALIGAAVGGYTARQRSIEVRELNAKLSETNKRMRKQMSRGSEFIGDSIDEGTDEAEIVQILRKGKRSLKEKASRTAHNEFMEALSRIQAQSSILESAWMLERKALRGLSAAEIQMKDYQSAEENLKLVVKLCEENLDPSQERPELADAYGCLADLYTECGQLDKAAEIYDKMIVEMGS